MKKYLIVLILTLGACCKNKVSNTITFVLKNYKYIDSADLIINTANNTTTGMHYTINTPVTVAISSDSLILFDGIDTFNKTDNVYLNTNAGPNIISFSLHRDSLFYSKKLGGVSYQNWIKKIAIIQ